MTTSTIPNSNLSGLFNKIDVNPNTRFYNGNKL
jgi:hypothetical protein